ncbi:MAG: hypothetical protein IJX19_08300, partial [Clostridia bacterium]|nr:hypothetical protein [Clostridia bacterium]
MTKSKKIALLIAVVIIIGLLIYVGVSDASNKMVGCPDCGETGQVDCGDCGATGLVEGDECEACEGYKWVDCETCAAEGEVRG